MGSIKLKILLLLVLASVFLSSLSYADPSFIPIGPPGPDSSNPLGLDSGGTGSSLVAPVSDSIFFYDVSQSKTDWLNIGNNLSIIGTTLNAAGSSGSPGGSDTQMQYNSAGSFGGVPNLLWNGTSLTVILPNANGFLPTTTGQPKFDYTTHLLYIGTGSTSVKYIPVASVANGGECTYSNAEGGRIYCNTASLTTIPGGSIYDIQINDGFSQFYGEDSFNYNPGTDVLTIGEIGTAGTINLEYSNSDTLTLKSAALSTNRTFTFPDTTGTGITTGDIQTVTNTMISGPITLAKGGTNQVLSDPNTDGIFFWDDSYGGVRFLDVGTGLLITGTTITATGSSSITDYVASVGTSVLTGLTGGAAGSSNAALSLALDYSQALSPSPALAAGHMIFGATGIIAEGATADSNEMLITVGDPTSDVVVTIPARTGSLVGDADVKKLPGQALNVTLPGQTFFLKIASNGQLSTSAGVTGTNVGDVQYRASSNTFGSDIKFNYTAPTGTLILQTPDDTSDIIEFKDSVGNVTQVLGGDGRVYGQGVTIKQGGDLKFSWSVGGAVDSFFTTDSANTFYLGPSEDQFGGSTGSKTCLRAGLGNTCMETADGTTEGILVQGTGGLTITSGKIRSNSTTGVGWSRQSAANQACNTTCPRGCAFGFDQGTLGVVLGSIVNCADASADQCICM